MAGALVLAGVLAGGLAGGVLAEQASDPASPSAGWLDVGKFHSCTVLADATLRCWGLGSSGQLGYGGTSNVGDVNTPAPAGPVNFGLGVTVKAIAAGDFHTCAILADGSVRCWGFGGDGRLGYGNTNNVLYPGTAGPVFLGAGRYATAITAGAAHTCAILDNGNVLCWGFGGAGHAVGGYGRLGYGNEENVGDTPTTTPGLIGPIPLPTGRTATAISAGGAHTCAILDDGSVLCWGLNANGQLGYGNTTAIGDAPPSPAVNTVGPVNLGGHKAVAISAGGAHTCAILDDGGVSCWGSGASGQLGYGNTSNVGDTSTDTPNLVGPVDLGGHRAVAISAGDEHTCAILDNGTLRCWGRATYGRLGYPTLDSFGNQASILAPSPVPVDLGVGRTAIAVSAGTEHTCALLDDHSVRCWGYGAYGQLGYCSSNSVGETNTPGSVGPVNLAPGDGGTTCPSTTTAPGATTVPPAGTTTPSGTTTASGTSTPLPTDQLALRAQQARARALRRCLGRAARRPTARRARARAACLKRYGRTPGAVRHLSARALSPRKIRLSFAAPGTDGDKPPAARAYVIMQSKGAVARGHERAGAAALCNGRCRFAVTVVGALVSLTVNHLQPHTTYHYTFAALDNVSGRAGPRSAMASARTR